MLAAGHDALASLLHGSHIELHGVQASHQQCIDFALAQLRVQPKQLLVVSTHLLELLPRLALTSTRVRDFLEKASRQAGHVRISQGLLHRCELATQLLGIGAAIPLQVVHEHTLEVATVRDHATVVLPGIPGSLLWLGPEGVPDLHARVGPHQGQLGRVRRHACCVKRAARSVRIELLDGRSEEGGPGDWARGAAAAGSDGRERQLGVTHAGENIRGRRA
mmetsp:Transcript_105699/g.340922  ORF Transcript_105699/g.340922 Transcript_105699/m.340922 type:complete len:220 (+) Transcript_105699:1199-1858(+)